MSALTITPKTCITTTPISITFEEWCKRRVKQWISWQKKGRINQETMNMFEKILRHRYTQLFASTLTPSVTMSLYDSDS